MPYRAYLGFALLLVCGEVQAELKLRWTAALPTRHTAWEFTQKMPRDTGYQPVVAGKLVLIGCEHNGALLALDRNTGKLSWRFYTNGPIRVAPIADGKSIYVASDDGQLYCLSHAGKLLWSYRGGRSNRRVIGRGRMISAWPAAARPLLHNSRIYYTAGYWPVDGVFVHAVDAKTGKRIWSNGDAGFRPFGQPWIEDNRLFVRGHHGNGIYDLKTGTLIRQRMPKRKRTPTKITTPGVKGTVVGRYRDDGLTFTVTKEGAIHCFSETAAPNKTSERPAARRRITGEFKRAKSLLNRSKIDTGYCLVAGLSDGSLVEGLLRSSKLRVVAVDRDAATIAKVRQRLEAAGLFDTHRLDVIHLKAERTELPPYFASLVVSERPARIAKSFHDCLRPFGGVLIDQVGGELKVTCRVGPPKGSDDWRQEFHDAANTLSSGDSLVKAPLGLLWYGGEAADARFYFDGRVDHQSGHGLNPQPVPAQIVQGRMILQGPGLLAAVDIYTGRILWESPLPKVYTFGGPGGGLGIHSRKHKQPWKHSAAMKFDVPPTHRCRASGFNMVSLPDGIYVAAGTELLRFDPASGKRLSAWKAPKKDDEMLCWGGLRASGEYLIATLFRPKDLADAQAGHDGNGGDWAGDRMPMIRLIVIDRQTGKEVWSRKADWGFINRSGIAAGNGRVYCVDLLTKRVHGKFSEAGRADSKSKPMLHAFDLKTGKTLWRFPLSVYVQNIAYSRTRDLLLVPCRNLMEWRDGEWNDLSIDRRRGKRNKNAPGRMFALNAATGKPAWKVEDSPYHTPHIVLGDLLIDRWGFAYDLKTGRRHQRTSAVTGQREAWSFRKSGCNHLVACPNLITWRTAFYDLKNHSGTMKLLGMDAGCSPTLLPAGGVLNIPNFGTHHKRNRMTAMALVHTPENELWTLYRNTREKSKAGKHRLLKRAGFNFGAQGDRVAKDGTVWFHVNQRNKAGLTIRPKSVKWVNTGKTGWRDSSAVASIEEIEIPLLRDAGHKPVRNDRVTRTCTIRMHLIAADTRGRTLRVSINGREFPIKIQAGSDTIDREFSEIRISGPVKIRFSANAGNVRLAGIELRLK